MSKYTTEIRYICETLSGLTESAGADSVDDVINKSWDKIFTTKTKFFDENYRSILCKKILKHYYLREIGCETVGIWKLWVNTRLEEIMPYYNQLYNSELLKFDPFHDVDLTREHKRTTEASTQEDSESKDNTTGNKTLSGTRTTNTTGNRTTNTNGESTDKVNGSENKNTTNTSENTKRDLYSDTPQGAITGLENENYLTNARKVTDDSGFTQDDSTTTEQNGSSNYQEDVTSENTDNTNTGYNENEDTTGTKTGTTTNTGSSNSTEDYLETIIGKQGTESYSSLLEKYRNTFLNIDMQVIEEFSDLFFNLW